MTSQTAWLRLIGGAFLCYLGVRTFLSEPTDPSLAAPVRGHAGAYASTLFLTLTNRFDSALTALPVSDAQRVQLVQAVESSAGAVIPALAANPATAAVAEAAQVAYTDATRLAALVAAGFLVVGLAASASLGRVPGRHERVLAPVPAGTASEGTA